MNYRTYVAFATAVLLAHMPARAAEEAGMVKVSKGQVSVQRGDQPLPAPVGTRIYSNDRVTTGPDGAVGITLRDNTLLSAGPNSTVDLTKFSFDSTTHAGSIDATVRRGTLSVISGKIAKATPEAVRFSAPGMTLGVRGTSFVIDAGP
ncbi:FecR domain-containing protein [Comamonadaceae bacterium G21597-S1]|nr:FecR domain-containing protein [Comamonadaceae bacterium G21597-S1]